MRYLVPADTARVLGANIDKCRNMRLILSRYLSEETVFNENVPDERNVKWRDKWLKSILSRFTQQDPTLKTLIDNEVKRWGAMTEHARRFVFNNPTRLIIGLGGKGALEFGITLHHVTGLPYIPSTALKGLTRSYALLTLAAVHGIENDSKKLADFDERLASDESKHAENSPEWHYRRAFGSQGSAGVCQFFDGVLSEFNSETLFTLEVMTPHFFRYYSDSGKSAPNDADNPNPVSFLTISAGNDFAFAVGGRGVSKDDDTVKQAFKWLRAALQEMGVGSKTSSGFGYFFPLSKS